MAKPHPDWPTDPYKAHRSTLRLRVFEVEFDGTLEGFHRVGELVGYRNAGPVLGCEPGELLCTSAGWTAGEPVATVTCLFWRGAPAKSWYLAVPFDAIAGAKDVTPGLAARWWRSVRAELFVQRVLWRRRFERLGRRLSQRFSNQPKD